MNIIYIFCSRFNAISGRSGVRGTIAEKYCDIFTWYEGDLDEVQKIYEKHKVGQYT